VRANSRFFFLSDFGGIRYTIQNQGLRGHSLFCSVVGRGYSGEESAKEARDCYITILYCFSIEMYNCYMSFGLKMVLV